MKLSRYLIPTASDFIVRMNLMKFQDSFSVTFPLLNYLPIFVISLQVFLFHLLLFNIQKFYFEVFQVKNSIFNFLKLFISLLLQAILQY